MATANKPVRIAGELFWARWMKEFNTKFDESNQRFECTFGMLSDKACEALAELNIRVKKKDTMGNFIVSKSYKGFTVVDEEGNSIDPEKIGNGSKAVALVYPYSHKMSAKYGCSPSFTKIIITDLKVYDPEGTVKEELEDVL
jgi:hypothetical protein